MSTIKATNIKLKRAYDPPASTDGIRILVDRLWPRGVKKADVGAGPVGKRAGAQRCLTQVVRP